MVTNARRTGWRDNFRSMLLEVAQRRRLLESAENSGRTAAHSITCGLEGTICGPEPVRQAVPLYGLSES
jgi:hypothetical protein